MAVYKDGERSVWFLVYSAQGDTKLDVNAVAAVKRPAVTQHVFDSEDVRSTISFVERNSSLYANGTYRLAAVAYLKGQPAMIITDGPIPKEGELEKLCRESVKGFLEGKPLGAIPAAKKYGFFEKKPKK